MRFGRPMDGSGMSRQSLADGNAVLLANNDDDSDYVMLQLTSGSGSGDGNLRLDGVDLIEFAAPVKRLGAKADVSAQKKLGACVAKVTCGNVYDQGGGSDVVGYSGGGLKCMRTGIVMLHACATYIGFIDGDYTSIGICKNTSQAYYCAAQSSGKRNHMSRMQTYGVTAGDVFCMYAGNGTAARGTIDANVPSKIIVWYIKWGGAVNAVREVGRLRVHRGVVRGSSGGLRRRVLERGLHRQGVRGRVGGLRNRRRTGRVRFRVREGGGAVWESDATATCGSLVRTALRGRPSRGGDHGGDHPEPGLIREYGTFGLLVVSLVSACVYFGPSMKKLVDTYPERKRQTDSIVENNTAALHTCEAALNNNTEALRENKEDRDRVTAILIKRDRKPVIRLEHQSESLGRIESRP